MLSRAALLTALALASFACATPHFFVAEQPLRRPVVDRTSDSSIRIRWPESFSAHGVVIYGGLDPLAIDRSTPLAIANGQSITLTHDDDPSIGGSQRLYFELVPIAGGASVITAERSLPLECCENFRDLGGYETTDGRAVRWDRVYRASDLSDLTGDDLAYLSRLDVKLVCDLRSDDERAADPDLSIEADAGRLELPIEQNGVEPKELRRKIRTGGMVALGIEQTMLDVYRAFVTDYADEWKSMFRRLERPESLPTLVHCSVGKDRTGFASALLLLALGVDEETVFEDYLLTNYYQQNFFRFVLRWVPLYSFFRTDPEDMLPLLEARREYLQAAFDEMTARYGSVDGYLEQALGVDAERRARLEHQLLQ